MGDVISLNLPPVAPGPEYDVRRSIEPLLDAIAKQFDIDRTILANVGDQAIVCAKEMMKAIDCSITLRTFPAMTSEQRAEILAALQTVSDQRTLHCVELLILHLPDLVRSIWGEPARRA